MAFMNSALDAISKNVNSIADTVNEAFQVFLLLLVNYSTTY